MTCLFTHDDLDGVGCAIVARLAFPDDLVVRYCSYKSINSEINSFLDSEGDAARPKALRPYEAVLVKVK